MTIETQETQVNEKTRVSLSGGDWAKIIGALIMWTAACVWGVERRVSAFEQTDQNHELRIVRVESSQSATDLKNDRMIEALSDIKASIARIEERTRGR